MLSLSATFVVRCTVDDGVCRLDRAAPRLAGVARWVGGAVVVVVVVGVEVVVAGAGAAAAEEEETTGVAAAGAGSELSSWEEVRVVGGWEGGTSGSFDVFCEVEVDEEEDEVSEVDELVSCVMTCV